MSEKKPTPKVITVTLDSLDLSPAESVRAEGYNAEHITRLVEAIERGEELPPVDVFAGPNTNYLGEGSHRVAATRQRREKSISARVQKFKSDEAARHAAVIHAAGSNENHGLNRTNADKRNAVTSVIGLVEYATSSDREIAEICRVNRSVVRAVREELSAAGQLTGKAHAKARNYKTEGKAEAKPVTDPALDMAALLDQPAGAVEPGTRTGSAVEAKEKHEAQRHGTPNVEPAADTVDPVQAAIAWGRELMSTIREHCRGITSAIDGAAEHPHGPAVAAIVQTVARDLKNVTENASLSVPYYSCPMGCTPKPGRAASCKICTSRGWITRHTFQTLTDDEKAKCRGKDDSGRAA